MEGELQLAAKFFPVGQVKLVFLNEELTVHFVGGVFHEEFVFAPTEDDADGRVVAFRVFLCGKIAEVQVHLPDVVVLHVVHFQVNENEAAEDAVVEDEVDPVVGVVQGDAVLSTDEGEAFAQFQKKGLEVVAEPSFEVCFLDGIGFGDFEELEDKGIAEKIAGLGDDLALCGELEDGVLVFSGCDAQEE